MLYSESMMNFNRDRGGRDSNRGGFRDRGPRRPVEMQKAICDECKRECEVPFKPTNGKPVFCSNCFEKNKSSDSRRFEGNNSRSSNVEDREMFSAVCDECGNSCQVPFRPRGDKPIYCSNCFGEKKGAGNRENEQPRFEYKNQLEALNNKLDKILQLLTPNNNVEVIREETVDQQPPQEVAVTDIETKPAKKRASKKTA